MSYSSRTVPVYIHVSLPGCPKLFNVMPRLPSCQDCPTKFGMLRQESAGLNLVPVPSEVPQILAMARETRHHVNKHQTGTRFPVVF